ncbi:MAG: PEP-CTERM sorting domain-containing protein [Planctomycetaceae bacterium]|nr:PEP-CTERM sorting domain-containing protein [Planctomycetaceae bacterium]
MRRRSPIIVEVVGLFLSVAGLASAAPSYIVTDLGSLGDARSDSHGRAINNSGQVVGYYLSTNGNYRPFLYTGNGPMQDLGTLPGDAGGGAYGINTSGQIAGYSNSGLNDHATLRGSSGSMQQLPTSGISRAADVNDNGQVVGYGGIGYHHAFFYDGAQVNDLGTFGGDQSQANQINNSGQIVGAADLADHTTHAFLSNNGGPLRDLGTLGGFSSSALAINEAGTIVGASYTSSGYQHAFICTGNGPMVDLTLGTAFVNCHSTANGINNKGQIVGGIGGGAAFIYSDGVMTDLSTLIDPACGWYLETAYAINDNGQILCDAIYDYGVRQQHALLLTPINTPEPSTLVLVGVGAVSLLACTWRRRRV